MLESSPSPKADTDAPIRQVRPARASIARSFLRSIDRFDFRQRATA